MTIYSHVPPSFFYVGHKLFSMERPYIDKRI